MPVPAYDQTVVQKIAALRRSLINRGPIAPTSDDQQRADAAKLLRSQQHWKKFKQDRQLQKQLDEAKQFERQRPARTRPEPPPAPEPAQRSFDF